MKFTLSAIVALVAVTLAPLAHAQGYFGLGVGSTKTNVDCSGTTRCDDTGTGGKVFGGYRFGHNLAAEVGYYNFGKASASDATTSAQIKASGFGAGVAFMGEFSPNWIGTARIGLARMKADVSGSMGSLSASDSDTSTQGYAGLSLGYAISRSMSIDAYADFSRAKYNGEKGNVRMVGIGLTAGF